MERERYRENYEKIPKELIERAKQVDLAEYLIGLGVPLAREGGRYRHREHHRLVFTRNLFYWNGDDLKGDTLDFVTKHMDKIGLSNLPFRQAITELTGAAALWTIEKPRPEKPAMPAFSIDKLTLSADKSRVVAYLCKTRKISYELVKQLIEQKMLFQEVAEYPDKITGNSGEMYNAVFPFYDNQGEIVGAEISGTLSNKRFKKVAAGSKYGFGYTIDFSRVSEDGVSDIRFVLFFESAIDLLSFIDIKTEQGKSLKGCKLVSLAGVKDNVLEHAMHELGGSVTPVMCVDNDEPGQDLIDRTMEKYPNARKLRPNAQFKDWNKWLQTMRE